MLLPFWTGFLPRLGAWIGLLRDGGWVNGVLTGLGLTAGPLPLLYSDGAMYSAWSTPTCPSRCCRWPPRCRGATWRWRRRRPTWALPLDGLPHGDAALSLPGAAAAFLLVFIPAAGEVVIPELLGPPEALLVGRVLWAEFFQNRDWPLAAALAVAVLAC